MAQADHAVGVCLYNLDAREEAVLKRVVTFSGSQGRNYVLAELASAQLVVVSNNTAVDLAAMHPQGAMLIRIADQDSEHPYDLLMQRPLLVTRVMRTLDDARKLWLESLAEAAPKATEAVHLTVIESAPVESVVQEPLVAVVDLVLPQPELVSALESSQQPSADLTTEAAPTVVEIPFEAKQAVELPSIPASVASIEASTTDSIAAPVQTATPNIESPSTLGFEYHHRALVVDDSAAIRKQLELELREAGIACDFAETGEEALQKVASATYDLVFLDIIMPGIDGYEACRQMRMRKEMKKTPIIMLSAKTSPLDEVQGVIAGASTYLTKPVKSEQLQKTLKRVAMWLDNFQQARS